MERLFLSAIILLLAFAVLPALAQDDAPTATLGITYRMNGAVSVVINTVAEGSAADRAGVRPGDTLVAIDDVFINFETVPDVLSEFAPGDVVTLLIVRDGVTLELETALDGRVVANDPGLLLGGGDDDPVIVGVAVGSPADGAGLQIGDRLVFIDGQQVDTGAAADAVLSTLTPGETVTIIVDRGGNAVIRTLTVGDGDASLEAAIPTATIDELAHGEVTLGVVLNDSSGFPVITEVVPGSPADEAGVRVGEIIRSVNGTDVRSSRDVINARDQFSPGDQIYLVLWDDNVARLLFLTLTAP